MGRRLFFCLGCLRPEADARQHIASYRFISQYLKLIWVPQRKRTMGYVMLSVTITVSVVAFRFFLSFFSNRARRFKHPIDVADISMNEADLVGFLLPKAARRVWNFSVLGAAHFVFGLPHHLVIWNFWRQREIDPWLYVHYAWTLIYWVALIALYTFILASHRKSQSR